MANAAVEIWHGDASGYYSEHTQPGYDGRGRTYLRAVQVTDANGRVTFTTIDPRWYAGRATYIHLEVMSDGNTVKTTQIAFPEAVTAEVYASGV